MGCHSQRVAAAGSLVLPVPMPVTDTSGRLQGRSSVEIFLDPLCHGHRAQEEEWAKNKDVSPSAFISELFVLVQNKKSSSQQGGWSCQGKGTTECCSQ